jgi:hypothetical protein
MVRELPETLGEPRAQYVIMKPDFFQLQKSTEPITVENRKYTTIASSIDQRLTFSG